MIGTESLPLVDLNSQHMSLRDELFEAFTRVLDSSAFILGPEVEAFERDFADYCGTRHAIGVASGTDAIQLMLRAAGVGTGDEVIIPAMTFAATALGVVLAGATPVLVDVCPNSALIDLNRVAESVTPRTKAILPVHLYGQCADVDGLAEIADACGLMLFEDAAQAHGSLYHGRRAGSLGLAAAFSFYPGKNLGALGDGGAVTTDSDDIARHLRVLRNWGSEKKYHHEEFGMNSRLDAVQAALLGAKLRRLDEWNERRRGHARIYDELLTELDEVAPALVHSPDQSVYHLYVVRCPNRNHVHESMNASGVQAGAHYPFAIHQLAAYRHLCPRSGLPVAESWADQCLSLPMFPELTADDCGRVVETLRTALRMTFR